MDSSLNLVELAVQAGSFPVVIEEDVSMSSRIQPGNQRASSTLATDETVDAPGLELEGSARPWLHPEESHDGHKRRHDDLVGATLAHYAIEGLIGRGSMGRVYKAHHLGLDRVCALKIMDPPRVSRQPFHREQFWAEARAAANLSHPHVVTIHNLGSDRGYHFIEMEYVPGAHRA